MSFDRVASDPMPPRFINKTYFFAGNEEYALRNLKVFDSFMKTNTEESGPIEMSLYIIGNKTHDEVCLC